MNASVFKQLQKAGITPESFPTLYQAILEVCVEIIREERAACVQVVEDHRKLWDHEKVGYAFDDVIDELRSK